MKTNVAKATACKDTLLTYPVILCSYKQSLGVPHNIMKLYDN